MTTMLRQELEKRIHEINEVNLEKNALAEEKQTLLRRVGEMDRTGRDTPS